MLTVTAEWVLPIGDPLIRRGSVTIDDGRIVSVDPQAAPGASDLGRVALLPGLVNAHTHLELSYLHKRVPPGAEFTEWVQSLLGIRRTYTDPSAPEIVDAARRAIGQARAAGTCLVGDVSNTLITVPLLREAQMPAQVFYELLGFSAPDPEIQVREARAAVATCSGADVHARGVARGDVRVSVAPHAPYSVSRDLFAAIRRDIDAHPPAVSTVHLGESGAEVELLRKGTGAMRNLLERFGVWDAGWDVPGVPPVEYLAGLGFLDSRVLAVHGVQFDGDELRQLRAMGTTLVSCPRSNCHVGVGSPPLEAFYAMDVAVALGTDSLASVADLNLFNELKEARRIAPRVPARELLRSVTQVPAEALGFGGEYGTIAAGSRAALLAVPVPDGVTDVEEYLVGSGIASSDLRWVS